MGLHEAVVNGQRIEFEDTSPLTVEDLRQQGQVPADEIFVRDYGNGQVQTVMEGYRIQAGESFFTIPKYIWG
jgi:hypothetical protein